MVQDGTPEGALAISGREEDRLRDAAMDEGPRG